MTFEEMLAQVVEVLRHERRVSYRGGASDHGRLAPRPHAKGAKDSARHSSNRGSRVIRRRLRRAKLPDAALSKALPRQGNLMGPTRFRNCGTQFLE